MGIARLLALHLGAALVAGGAAVLVGAWLFLPEPANPRRVRAVAARTA